MPRALVPFALFLLALLPASPLRADPLPPDAGVSRVAVTFRLNDAMIKNKMLDGVKVGVARAGAEGYLVTGTTGVKGVWVTELPPGEYLVSYRKPGYVSVDKSPTPVSAKGDQTITTTLSPMLESTGEGGRRRVQIVLNWGSAAPAVRDADSHIQRADLEPPLHVLYNNKVYATKSWSAELDVDDTDWGGPETITLLDPPAGRYTYWVHDYSNERSQEPMSRSGVKVRVVEGDRVVAEFSPKGDAKSRYYRPFAALEIDAMGDLKLVPFTEEELGAQAHTAEVNEVSPPVDSEDDDHIGQPRPADEEGESLSPLAWILILGGPLIIGLALFLRHRFRD